MVCKSRRLFFFFQLLFLTVIFQGYSQEKNFTVKEIQTLIEQDSLSKARSEVAKSIAFYRSEKKYDSLYNYVQFEGSFKLNNGDKNKAIKKAQNLTEEIKKTASPHFIVEAITELGWIY